MTRLSKEQQIQENAYTFPYHYIPRWDHGRFSQVLTLKWGYEYASYMRFVLSLIELLDFESLLDVGCGDGRLLREVSACFPGKRLSGLDRSEHAVKLGAALNPGIEFVCGDIGDPETLSERFDVITLVETLEHIPPDETERFVRGLHYRLKPGGTLILTVPSTNVEVHPKHYRHFDLESLCRTIEPFFSVAESHFINVRSSGAKFIERILANQLYVLNDRRLVNLIYGRYERSFLRANEKNAKRVCAVCRTNSADVL